MHGPLDFVLHAFLALRPVHRPAPPCIPLFVWFVGFVWSIWFICFVGLFALLVFRIYSQKTFFPCYLFVKSVCLGRDFHPCNLKNNNCSELLMTIGMRLNRAPFKVLTSKKFPLFVVPPNAGWLLVGKWLTVGNASTGPKWPKMLVSKFTFDLRAPNRVIC